jgi:hypothetical protein
LILSAAHIYYTSDLKIAEPGWKPTTIGKSSSLMAMGQQVTGTDGAMRIRNAGDIKDLSGNTSEQPDGTTESKASYQPDKQKINWNRLKAIM